MKSRSIAILHNQPVPPGGAFSEASIDVLTQVEAIEGALAELKYSFRRIEFTRDIAAVIQRLAEADADAVINLCESVDEDPAFIGHPAAILELMDIPFTGSSSLALMLTTDKLTSKRLMKSGGITSPGFGAYDGGEVPQFRELRYPVLVKPRLQDASIGIEQDSVFENQENLRRKLEELYSQFGPLLIEEYIDGREFNVSIIGFPEPEALPVAEIIFEGFPAGMYKIIGYKAKWDESSFEYEHTVRDFPHLPGGLEGHLKAVSLECFRLFMLRDYARVDIRLNEQGAIHVLEVNANPCLSPDCGFPAAAKQAGMNYTQMVRKLLYCVEKRISR